ncbi:hypothetical protein SEUCBS139899_003158 [Sporothrix eucalyptigena]|uniref:WW domain-containing protein n=1 Tax=Sporothrix eucalyptigena TaxID=1812306 RepID=A0ABP0AZF1_9PEZI
MANRSGAAPTAAASSSSLPPLPPGWTENKAPTGHTYYYNAQTRESTYKRPAPPPPSIPPPPPAPPGPPAGPPRTQPPPSQPFPGQHVPLGHGPQAPAPFLRLSDPRVANAFMAQQQAANNPHDGRGGLGGRGRGGGRGGRGGRGGADSGRPHFQPTDKPRSRIPIPGHEPWVLVYTKLGRRFVHNTDKNTSFWRIPDKLMPAILELDKAGIQQKVEAAMKEGKEKEGEEKKTEEDSKAPPEDDLESEYEEVEVTDDEGGEGEGEGSRRKRQRTEEAQGDEEEDYIVYDEPDVDAGTGGRGGPVEFGEEDIAFQLQAAAAAYDDEDDYGEGEWDGEGEEYGDEGKDGQDEDGASLFRAMLDDFKINPFSPWEKLIEEGKVFDDPRYTALPNMRARREVWEAWSKEGIARKKSEREREHEAAAEENKRKDPRAAYLRLLQDHATPKLYWPEFKRKFRKDPALKDSAAPHKEKDKEKLYRDYVARRKLPAGTRKADLTKLLESLPASVLNSQTSLIKLPLELTGDLRYVAMEAQTRNELVEAFLKTAGPPP